MLAFSCPFCGQPVDLSQWNLLGTFERYLMLSFVLSLAIRFQQYRINIRFFLRLPREWPEMFKVIKEHSGVFLTWTMIVPVSITFSVLAAHTLCLRLVFRDADVTWPELWAHWGTLLPIVGIGLLMLTMDAIAIFSSGQTDFDEIEQNLSRGEFALTSRMMKAVKWISFKSVDPEKIVENRIKETFGHLRLLLIGQLRRWSFHTAVRIAFGFLLWISWARVEESLSVFSFVVAVLGVLAVLGLLLYWMRQPLTETLPA